MPATKKETKLLLDASPCDTNFYEGGPTTVVEAKKIGKSNCPHLSKCLANHHQCIMRSGVLVAGFVASQGNTIEDEVEGDFKKEILGEIPKEGLVWSPDRKKFTFITDKKEILSKVKEFATLALFGERDPQLSKEMLSSSSRRRGTLTQHPVSTDGVSIDAGETAIRAAANVKRDGGVPIHACGARSYRDCPCGTCVMGDCAACFASMY